jgi:DNA-binding NarL/FixJ family response regulator
VFAERYGNRIPNERELRVIELVAQGLKNGEVAEAIGISECVVKNYLRVIYDKLGVWNRVELALWYEARRHRKRLQELKVKLQTADTKPQAVAS